MPFGAGLLVAVAAGAAAAGWWLLGGLVLAAGLAWGSARIVPPELTGWRGAVLTGTSTAGVAARLALYGSVFAAFLLPSGAAAAGFVLLATAADVLGVRVDRYYRRLGTGLLLVAAAAFVALCVAVAPVAAPAAGTPGVAGVALAAAVAFPLFAGLGRSVTRVGVATLAGLAVAAAALYQLGPVRLGLSPTSLTDVLAAADAQAMRPVLAVVVLVATVPAALVTLRATHAPEASSWRRRAADSVPAGLVAALLAGMLDPVAVLAVAAALGLGDVLVRAAFARARWPAAVAGGVAVLLLVFLPPGQLLVAVAVAGVATAYCGYRFAS